MLSQGNDLFSLRDTIVDLVNYNNRNTKGKILTVFDAAITDSTQRKAIKDLIFQSYNEFQLEESIRNALWNWCEARVPNLLPKDKHGFFGIAGSNLADNQ